MQPTGYIEDLMKALHVQADLIKQQALFEVIQIVSVCDTYEEFKRAMYGKALEFMRSMEAEGSLPAGTTEKIAKGDEITHD